MNSHLPGWRMALSAAASALAASSAGVLYVYNVAEDVIKPFMNSSYYSHYDSVLSAANLETLWAVTTAIPIVGFLAGLLLMHVLAEKFGRKTTGLVISPVLGILSAILQFFAKYWNSLEAICVGRALSQCSLGIGCIIPIYMTECALTPHRGFVGTLSVVLWYFWDLVGMLLAQPFVFGTETLWPFAAAYAFIPTCCAIGLSRVLKESPKYLFIVRKDVESAKEAIRFYHGPSVDTEPLLEEYRMEDKLAGLHPSIGFREIFKEPHLRRSFFICCVVVYAMEASGIAFVANYSTGIFIQSGFSKSLAKLASMLSLVFSLLIASFVMFCIETIGRRPAILAAVAIGFVANLIFLAAETSIPQLAVIGVVLVKLAHDALSGPLAHYIFSEIAPLASRSITASFAWSTKQIIFFTVSLTFPILHDQIGYLVYLIFIMASALIFAWLWHYMPETTQRPVGEITLELLDNEDSQKEKE